MHRSVVSWGVFGLLCAAAIAVSASGEPVPPLPEGAFCLVALPDTQAYSDDQPEVFEAEIRWILDHLEDQRIAFVSHLGDIVDRNGEAAQWDVAERCIKMLDGRVPYGLAVGNHDMVGSSGDSSKYQARFPESHFSAQPWYGGSYKNNANSWQTFSAEGMDFLIVHLECNAPDDVLEWAGRVLDGHPKHRAIVSTHMYLGPAERPQKSEDYYDAPKGRMRWKKCHGAAGNTPQQMWEKRFRKHENLFLILCGDQSRTQAFYQRATGVAGNTVHELCSDYREGYFRVYRFLPGENRIDVLTYSPSLGKLCDATKFVPGRERHQFSLPYPMEGPYERAAKYILQQSGLDAGYCLDYGAGEGMLARALADGSRMKVLGVEEDGQKVQAGRSVLHAADVYGPKVTLHQTLLGDLPYRDYAAVLVTSSAMIETGACPGTAAEMFRMLRPDGGVAILGQPPGCPSKLEEGELRAWLDEADLEYTITNTPAEGLWARIERGPLPGAGEWTHMWADLGNTACSGDTRTTDQYDVLWFGEPGPSVMVDRHWEPVSPLYKRGRLYVPGFDRIVCVDAYNGARYWDLDVPNSSRIAMMRDAGNLALDDTTLHVAVEDRCLRVDVKTGQVRDMLRVTTKGRDWGYLAVDGTRIYGGEQLAKASYLAATTGPGAEGNQLGRGDNRLLITSRALFCRDKATDEEVWRYEPAGSVIANPTICIGEDGVYLFETAAEACVTDADGRVLMADFTKGNGESLVKLDRDTGAVVWRRQHDMLCRHVFHLSCAKGMLVASGCTTKSGNFWYHLRAYNAGDGAVIWERDLDSTFASDDTDHGKQDKHPLLIGSAVQLKQGNFDLTTGEPRGVSFSTSNCADCAASMNHVFTRNGSVATVIGLDKGGAGKPLCSAMRPGCYISIIPAGGVAMLPAMSAGCTCAHSIQTSIAWLPR